MRYEIDRRKSELGDYELIVVDYDSATGNRVRMLAEVENGGDIKQVVSAYSASYVDPELMHAQPMRITVSLFQILACFLYPDWDVVIAGLGAGSLHHLLASKGVKVVSVEPDQAVIDIAREFWEFDGMVRHDTIEHWLTEQVDGTLDCLVVNAFCAHNDVTPVALAEQHLELFLTKLDPNRGVLILDVFEESTANVRRAIEERGGLEYIELEPTYGLNQTDNTIVIISPVPLVI